MKFSTPNNHYWNLLLFFCSLHVSLKARSRRYKVKILYNIRINNNWIKILGKNPLRGWKKKSYTKRTCIFLAREEEGRKKKGRRGSDRDFSKFHRQRGRGGTPSLAGIVEPFCRGHIRHALLQISLGDASPSPANDRANSAPDSIREWRGGGFFNEGLGSRLPFRLRSIFLSLFRKWANFSLPPLSLLSFENPD